jgi:Asp/Glu/hydantoin racemase
MVNNEHKFRFLLIQAFHLSGNTKYQLRPMAGTKESMLMNYGDFAHLLDDVAWDVDPGATDPHGNWPVETREEFAIVGVSRLPIVKAACESGKYNAIVLLGGGDPGFPEAREIGRRYGIPVTACFSAQLHIAAMLGNKFSVIDISEAHNMHLCDLVVRYRFQDECASVRNVNFPLPRPPEFKERPIQDEKQKVDRGEKSEMLETAITESIAAIEEDGAEVLVLGCSGAFWMQPHLQKRLTEMGWEIPVLEGYRCAIEQAKTLVNLGVDASGLMLPGDKPKKWRRKKLV